MDADSDAGAESDPSSEQRVVRLGLQLYQAAMHTANWGVVIYDHRRRILDANEAFLRLVGGGREQTVGRPLTDALPASVASNKQTLAMFSAALSGETVPPEELSFSIRGRPAFWELSVSPLRDGDGAVLAGMVTIEEISRRIESRRQRIDLSRVVEQRAAELDAVLTADPAAIALLRGPQLSYALTNANYRALISASQADPRGRRFAELNPFGPRRPAAREIQAVRNGAATLRYDDVPISLPGNRTRHYSYHFVPVPAEADDDRGVLIVLWETTPQVEARRRVEALAHEAATRSAELRAIIDGMAEGVYVCDPSGIMTLVNEAGARIVGHVTDPLFLEMPPFVIAADLRYPDGQPVSEDERPLARSVHNDATYAGEFLVRRPGDDADSLLHIASSPIHDLVSGRLMGAVAVVNDITELRRLERQREEFLTMASHELRTPVASIKGYAQMLQRLRERDAVEPERLARSLMAIDRETDRLTRLISGFLDVSRTPASHFQLRLARLDLRDLVSDVVERFSAGLDGRHHIEIALSGTPIWIEGERDRLEQILQQFLSNAVKFSPGGGLLRVCVAGDGDEASVAVVDDGIGIPAEDIGQLCQPYFRAGNASGRDFAGLGLGLYIGRMLAEQHRGRIETASEGADRGATFTLYLPVVAPPPAEEPAPGEHGSTSSP